MLFARTGVEGQALRVTGNTSMTMWMSDHYTLLDNLSVNGLLQRIPPLSQFDEVASMLQFPEVLSNLYSVSPLVKILTLIPFLIVAVVFLTNYRKDGKEDSKSQHSQDSVIKS